MADIQNMRVVSDDPSLLHLNSLQPVALGTIEEIDGKSYKVIDNMQMMVVTYAPIDETEKHFTIETRTEVTQEQIDDVVCTALEGGITYWCNRAKVKDDDYRGTEWAHEVVTRGGTLVLHDAEEEIDHELNLQNLMKGFSLTKGFDFEDYDAGDADQVIQNAIFGEVIYG
ncbi:hypothetical protein KDA23_07970 [Candidatus Saccharibacteria bacterium]|nr:hypothetical protein [Candidatus Saccharibacteria bacterium]